MNKIMWRNDKNLSLTAKGLFIVIENYFSHATSINKEGIMDMCLEGKTAFETAWKELKNKKYLKQIRRKDDDGQFYYQYHLNYVRGEQGERPKPNL